MADLEAIAFRHNPTLAAAVARIEMARGRQIQAGLYPNPVAGYHATEIGNRGSAGQQGGFVSQRVITGGKRILDQAVAGAELAASQLDLRAQELRVLNDVRLRYVEALVAQRRVELTTELARISDKLASATQVLVDSDQVSQNDLLQAEIRAHKAHLEQENAVNEQHEALRRLAATVGLPGLAAEPPLQLRGDLSRDMPNLETEATFSRILADHPARIAASVRAERAALAVRRARREPIPNVDVSLSFRHHNVTGSDVTNVQVGMPLPVFDRNQGNIHRAEAEWIAASREIERIELQLQDQFARVHRQYANARQQVERYRDRILPRAAKSLRIVTEGFENGQVEYLTMLNAQQTYVEASLAHLASLKELQLAATLLEGQLLADSLSERTP